VVGVSALTLLVGWQEGHQVHKITVPLTSKGSVPEQMEEETKEEPSNQGSPGHTYTTVLRSFIRTTRVSRCKKMSSTGFLWCKGR